MKTTIMKDIKNDNSKFIFNDESYTPSINFLKSYFKNLPSSKKRNLSQSLQSCLDKIDNLISNKISIIMHDSHFQNLESLWRSTDALARKSKNDNQIKIKILNLSKTELIQSFSSTHDVDQSPLYKLIYENEFGTPGGEPFGVMMGDYYFSHQNEDVESLQKISHIASHSFCPFITAPCPSVFGVGDFSQLSKPKQLDAIFNRQDYIAWNALRESDEAKFLTLCLPRVLLRLPHRPKKHSSSSFNFQENTQFLWKNAAFSLAEKMCEAFSRYRWCTAIRGAETGGKITKLPLFHFHDEHGALQTQCPTEICITDKREAELSQLGFMPISYYKNSDFAVFFGAQTFHRPPEFLSPEANANAQIASRLPYVMASSRFAQYLKIIARDKIGAFSDVSTLEAYLNQWVVNYVNANPASGSEMKAKYPLADARISVRETLGNSGSYHAILWMKPWLQLEKLTASLRLVADIPKKTSA